MYFRTADTAGSTNDQLALAPMAARGSACDIRYHICRIATLDLLLRGCRKLRMPNLQHSNCICDQMRNVARRAQLHTSTDNCGIGAFQFHNSIGFDCAHSLNSAGRSNIQGINRFLRDVPIVANLETVEPRRDISAPDSLKTYRLALL